jgi:hypothetical protein
MSKQWDNVVNKNKSPPPTLIPSQIVNKAYKRISLNNTVSLVANQLNLTPYPGIFSLFTPKFSIYIRSLLDITDFDQVEDMDINEIKTILDKRINDFVVAQEVDISIPKTNRNSIGNNTSGRNSDIKTENNNAANNNINTTPNPPTIEPSLASPSASPMKGIFTRKLGNIMKDIKSPVVTCSTSSASVTPLSNPATPSETSIVGRFSAFYNKISSPKLPSTTDTNQIKNDSSQSSPLPNTTIPPPLISNDNEKNGRSNLEIFLEGKDNNSQNASKELDFFEEDDGEDDDEDDDHVNAITDDTTIDNLVDIESMERPSNELMSSSNLLNDFMNDADDDDKEKDSNKDIAKDSITEDVRISLDEIALSTETEDQATTSLIDEPYTTKLSVEETRSLIELNQDVCSSTINSKISDKSTVLLLDFDEEADAANYNTPANDETNQPIGDDAVVDTTISSDDAILSIDHSDNTKDTIVATKNDTDMHLSNDSVINTRVGIISTNTTKPVIDTTTPKKTTKSAMDTQLQLSECYEKLYISSKKVIGIHCRTPCSGCGMALLDEEILSNWCGFGENNIINNNNIYDAHRIVCKDCQTHYQPLLSINCYEINNNDDDMKLIWSSQVRYISPYGVRYGMEESMQLLGNVHYFIF